LRERLARLLDGLLPLDVKPPDPSLEDDEFVNVTAQAVEMPEASRQELLEDNNVLGRARGLVERLSK